MDKDGRSHEPTGLHLSASFMTQATSAESTLDGGTNTSDEEAETTDQVPNISNLKLVFGTLERGLPSLQRGYRTPDPSPSRTGLPKCGPYVELLEGTREPPSELSTGQRGRDVSRGTTSSTPSPVHQSWRLQTPSPEPPMPPMPMDGIPFAFQREERTAGQVDQTAYSDLKHPWCVSFGSHGHPLNCAPACKYATRGKGCKDGAKCDHCHLCKWKKPMNPAGPQPIHGRKLQGYKDGH
mmetsp:Transcript_23524/g.54615  ORF Transcript_23524/g.54615 Transcript_23524/m.54615 type:complete len:238 (-) Transcript_23524:147-860(-)